MNKKNWLCLLLAAAFAFTTFNSCKKSESNEDDGIEEWVKSSAFDGDPRSFAASFQIGNTGYLATGILSTNERVNDAWSFTNNIWTKLPDFAGEARNGAVGFSINGVGFIGTGFNGTDALSDFWKYEPQTQKWTKIADFPGEARYGAVAFTLGGFGYVGTGATKTQKTLKDFYKYDPSNDTWEVVNTPFKNKRVNAFAFVIGNKAYVGGGIDNNQYPEDFYSFDGTAWNELAPLKDKQSTYDLTRQAASSFVIGNNGFVVGGKKSSVLGTTWKYDSAKNEWIDIHDALPQNAREGAVSYSIDSKGYLTTGANGSFKFDDTWVFTQIR
ncbi:Kelch repeat-containing protein [Sphingobacterium rhinopitheci]|uniref:Kelch repeat-containing protein n=1 Tax=Sphingobacterium rhinopitheci TaxID=2781960 RepID=UPI001F519776|nr:kelch repeat-containing protein [Sphingobacterium rhinopitheci]MCI0921448.1 hypothetical protein [Sphingobacterium rhinopitheci]